MSLKQFIPFIWFFVTISSFAFGCYDILRNRKKIKYWYLGKGIVCGFKEGLISGGAKSRSLTVYALKVIFTAKDGRQIKFTDSSFRNKPYFQIDEEVSILYNPDNFDEACVYRSSWDFYSGSIWIITISLFLTFIGILWMLMFGSNMGFNEIP